MRAFNVFFKKEWQESIAHYRLLILLILFTLFGLMNVFAAKFTPELITYLVSEDMAKMIPTPTMVDSWIQFFKNIGQVGMVVVVILFSGILTNEYSKGTLVLLITKGLSRWKIIMAKWSVSVLIFSLSYVAAIAVTWIYSKIYFKEIEIPNLPLALFIFWLFVVFLISLIIFASVLVKSNYLVLLFTGGVSVILWVLNLIPEIKKFNPINLGFDSTALIQASKTATELNKPIIVTICLIIILNGLSIMIFNKKSL